MLQQTIRLFLGIMALWLVSGCGSSVFGQDGHQMAIPPSDLNTRALNRACRDGKLEEVQQLIESGTFDVNYIEPNDRLTALDAAVIYKQYAIGLWLIQKGANVNLFDSRGATPIFYACALGHTDMVQLLLQHGADVNVISRNYLKNTPAHEAAAQGWLPVLQMLARHGADFNIKDSIGQPPLELAQVYLVIFSLTDPAEREKHLGQMKIKIKGSPPQDVMLKRFKETVEFLKTVTKDTYAKPAPSIQVED